MFFKAFYRDREPTEVGDELLTTVDPSDTSRDHSAHRVRVPCLLLLVVHLRRRVAPASQRHWCARHGATVCSAYWIQIYRHDAREHARLVPNHDCACCWHSLHEF